MTTMTLRERMLAALRSDPIDRIPVVHFGFWPQTLNKWAEQGHVTEDEARHWGDGNAIDAALSERLGFDHSWSCCFGPDNGLRPPFKWEVIRELPDGSRHVQNHEGVIELEVPGAVSIRAEIEHLLQDRESWEKLYKPRLQYAPERVADSHVRLGADTFRFGDSGATALENAPGEYPRGLFCGSLIGRIRNYLGVEGMSYLMADDPELLTEIIDTNGELCLRCTEETLKHTFAFDFAHFWEDICFNGGPLVSPRFFEESVSPWYAKITELLRAHGIELVSVDCDGCIDMLVPLWLEAGVNIMFPIEVGTWNASFAPWRKQYGDRVMGVGGVRKHVFAEDRAAVDREIERLRPIIALGGFIPCPDHRLPPETEWELVQYYADQLRALKL